MSLILSGTDGLSDVDGSAATPAIRGTDANTGIFFGTDIIGFAEGGAEVARFNADAQFVAAAGTASLPVITTTGDVNTGIFFPAADTVGISTNGTSALSIDASQNITTTNKFAKASMPTGSVLQVVQTTKTDSFSTTSTSYTTFISVSITPTSASNKVLITFGANGGTPGDVCHGYLAIFRGATQLFKADTAGNRRGATSVINTATQQQFYYGGTFLDSPATTSSTTYTIQVLSSNGTAVYLNRSGRDNDALDYDGRSVSSITVMEIAA